MVRGQIEEFCGCSSNGRKKRFCIPGTKVDDTTAASENIENAFPETHYIVHVGKTNILKPKSE